jgi:hypothetical protein
VEVFAAQPKRRTVAPRVTNVLSLKEAILQAIQGKSLTKEEVHAAVSALGYTFKTSNPLNSIGTVLYGKKPRFKNDGGKFSLAWDEGFVGWQVASLAHARKCSRGGPTPFGARSELDCRVFQTIALKLSCRALGSSLGNLYQVPDEPFSWDRKSSPLNPLGWGEGFHPLSWSNAIASLVFLRNRSIHMHGRWWWE